MTDTIRIAVVGAGPSGFYAAQALTRQLDNVRVDLFERLPTPYGLVRYGVAPDHPKLKAVTKVFDSIAAEENIRFIGNIALGSDLTLTELTAHYRGVIVATGTEVGNKPGVPGETLTGCITAAQFVGWFNGHPDHQDYQFDLSAKHVAVIGNGNVALDVARILLRPVEELQTTDITANALDCLRDSKVTDVHIIGRRGPVNVSFGKKELREIDRLDQVQCFVDPADLALNPELQEILDNDSERQANYDLLAGFAKKKNVAKGMRRCHFHFYQSTTELEGKDQLESLILKSNLPDRPVPTPIDCALAIFSIGYHSKPVDTLPISPDTGAVPNDEGRVLVDGQPLKGVYVSGWLKRGPTGLIGTNRADSVETVEALIKDLDQLPEPASNADIMDLLHTKGHQTVSYDDWMSIRRAEEQQGAQREAPAEKFTNVADMLKRIEGPHA